MDQVMTIEEIEEQFKDEWVLVGDPVLDDHLAVQSGKVLCHSKDRDEFDQAALEFQDGPIHDFAWLYNGEIPEGTAVLL